MIWFGRSFWFQIFPIPKRDERRKFSSGHSIKLKRYRKDEWKMPPKVVMNLLEIETLYCIQVPKLSWNYKNILLISSLALLPHAGANGASTAGTSWELVWNWVWLCLDLGFEILRRTWLLSNLRGSQSLSMAVFF